jgi:hypothetical protein
MEHSLQQSLISSDSLGLGPLLGEMQPLSG